MAESTLSISFLDIAGEVGSIMGFDRTYSSMSTDEKAIVDAIIDRGMRQFYNPPLLPGETFAHEWSFLHPIATLVITAPYSTGTVVIVSGVVTLTGGTWPSWAADADLNVNGNTYAASTRDSGVQITLADVSVNVSGGDTFTLEQTWHDLPDAFGGIDGTFSYETGTTDAPLVRLIDENQIRGLRQFGNSITGKPAFAALRPKSVALSTTVGTRWQVGFYPPADAAYPLQYRYHALTQRITSTDELPLGGMAHGETILSSCMAIAALRTQNALDYQRHFAQFLSRLAASIAHDRQLLYPNRLGYNGDWSDGRSLGCNRHDPVYVTYNDTLYTGD